MTAAEGLFVAAIGLVVILAGIALVIAGRRPTPRRRNTDELTGHDKWLNGGGS